MATRAVLKPLVTLFASLSASPLLRLALATKSSLSRQFLRPHHIGLSGQSFLHRFIVVPRIAFVFSLLMITNLYGRQVLGPPLVFLASFGFPVFPPPPLFRLTVELYHNLRGEGEEFIGIIVDLRFLCCSLFLSFPYPVVHQINVSEPTQMSSAYTQSASSFPCVHNLFSCRTNSLNSESSQVRYTLKNWQRYSLYHHLPQ